MLFFWYIKQSISIMKIVEITYRIIKNIQVRINCFPSMKNKDTIIRIEISKLTHISRIRKYWLRCENNIRIMFIPLHCMIINTPANTNVFEHIPKIMYPRMHKINLIHAFLHNIFAVCTKCFWKKNKLTMMIIAATIKHIWNDNMTHSI